MHALAMCLLILHALCWGGLVLRDLGSLVPLRNRCILLTGIAKRQRAHRVFRVLGLVAHWQFSGLFLDRVEAVLDERVALWRRLFLLLAMSSQNMLLELLNADELAAAVPERAYLLKFTFILAQALLEFDCFEAGHGGAHEVVSLLLLF